jgi:AcrR family transcriptional regulator
VHAVRLDLVELGVERRILDAVYQRLRKAPAEAVSVDLIARPAGVSRSTVYLVFGSRSGLFDALGADLLRRGGFGDMLRVTAHPDARAALRGGDPRRCVDVRRAPGRAAGAVLSPACSTRS